MMTGETEEMATCGRQKKVGRMMGGGGGGCNMKPPRSFTTLSTIAIQAGQSQIVVSVLKSGSVVHLELVQVHPGLCEIGSNQEENQTLIKEQQQLIAKLKKHEGEVLAVVENRQTEQRRKRRDEGMTLHERNRKKQVEEEVHKAMAASLSEGWSLLLHLLWRRQEVLKLASDFYRQALEFADSIDRVEDLQIRPDSDRLSEVQLTYDSMRRDLLGKSLQVLNSSSVLLQKLRELGRTEALQRTGRVQQDEEGEEDNEGGGGQSSQCSRGLASRLEELVEALQDRRRRADQAVRQQLQQAENNKKEQESRPAGSEDLTLTIDKILVQNLLSESTSSENIDLQSKSRTKETINLQPGSRAKMTSGFRPDETKNSDLGSKSDLKPESKPDMRTGSKLDVRPESRSEHIRNLQPGSKEDMRPGSRLETRNFGSESRSDLKSESSSEIKPGSSSEKTRAVDPGFRSDETRNSKSQSRSDLKHEFRSQENKDLQLESRSGVQSGSRSDLQLGFRLELKPGHRLEDIRNLQSRFKFSLKAGSTSDLKSDSKSKETRDLQSESTSDVKSESKSDETKNVKPGSRLDQMSGSRSEQTRNEEPGFRSEDTRKLESGSRSDIKPESRSDMKPRSRSEGNNDLWSESRPEETMKLGLGTRSDIKRESRSDLDTGSNSEKMRNLQPGSRKYLSSVSTSEEIRKCEWRSRSDLKPRSRVDLKTESRSGETIDRQPGSRSEPKELLLDLQARSRSEKTTDLQSASTLVESRDLQPGFKSKEVGNLQPGSRSEETKNSDLGSKSDLKPESKPDLRTGSKLDVRCERMLIKESQTGEDHAHQAPLTNQRQQLVLSCERILDKVWSSVQQCSSVLSESSEAGQQLFEAEDTLNIHMQLHTQAEFAGRDAENLKWILDQLQALHTDPTSRTTTWPPGQPSRQLSPLKALTEQLKKGGMGRQIRASDAQPVPPAADPTGSLGPELAGRVDLALKELQILNRKIDSNLHLLQPYVAFLRTALQVEEEMEGLREIYRMRPEVKEEEKQEREAVSSSISPTSSVKKERDVACWQETLQRLLDAQELGNNYVHTVAMVSGSGLNLQSVVSVVQQTIKQLNRSKEEVNELRNQQKIQIQQQEEDMKYCRKYKERLHKTLQDLNCVSELMDSCTRLDLGSDLQTSRLLECFSQAGPHFIQLDAEVEYVMKSWETLRGVQERLEVKEVKGGAVKEEDLSELQKLQRRVKDKIQQSESILDLTSNFHLAAQQLEALLHSDPVSPLTGTTGLRRPGEAEMRRHREDQQQQIQSLFKTASMLKTDICSTISHSGWAGFRLEQLEARLISLDSLSVSWLNEAARCEEKLRRELLAHLRDHINQLRESFKDLKKQFANLKFNYLMRNDRTSNMKAVRNQLQQVELYKEKLQALRKRLQGVTARLGSEVKDGVVAREVEDAVNELRRQMGEFEQSFREHQKTLDMTCKLQQAMEEYQFWCEEASVTITRVGKFSSQCRSTEAVAVLYRQFEKFIWPTVPQQEERISQITELAVQLHGLEEGRRYIEKMVSKHSKMMESIRELSDGLMELEAKLRLDSLKQQQNNKENEMKEEGEMERRRENHTAEKDEEDENKLTENRSTQEAADLYELKETGHTPELTAEHDGKEVPMKRQTEANRRPPLQKSRSQEADRQTVHPENSHRQQLHSKNFNSYCSTHTVSLSCSPVEAVRRVHAINSQLQPVNAEPQATPPPPWIDSSPIGVQRQFQRKEMREQGQQDTSVAELSEAELQQQEVMTEDSLSNDEYECVSPDDISLPPLAETPESIVVQSDNEEGLCFGSHSVHINQYSQHYHTQSEHSGTGPVRQQRESSQTEGYPTPPAFLQGSKRFRSESSLFVKSPSTVPASGFLTSTLCTVLRTEETRTTNLSQATDLKRNITDSVYKDNDIPERRGPSKMEPLLNDHNSQYNQPQKSKDTQGKSTPNVRSRSETLPQTDPYPRPEELDQNPTLPKSSHCPQPFNGPDLDSRSVLDQDGPSSQTSKETSSVNMPQSSSSTMTTSFTQQTIYCQSSPSDKHCNVPQVNSTLRSKQESPYSQRIGDLHDAPAPILPVPNCIGDITISSSTITSSNRLSSKQSLTIYSLHESLTSTSTQQCVHDRGMTPSSPAKPAAPPQPETQTQALAQQANLHVTPPSSPPHLLTSDQDPDICQPMAIREEIKLTPQIQGPPLPAPPLPAPPLPQAQTESIPKGKASKSGLPCFTRPLSRATVMEGSPVTLEVEVAGDPEPMLTWFKDGDVSAVCLGHTLVCEDGKHFLFVPEVPDSDGASYEPRAADHHNLQRAAGNSSSSSDKWLVAEVFGIISVDWQTWFGALCVLLWLLYLIVL